MLKVLIVYDTVEGQTAKIAQVMGDEFKKQGIEADVIDAQSAMALKDLDVTGYNAVIAGGPLHMQHYPKNLETWVRKNASKLSQVPNAFFTVCLAVLSAGDARVQTDLRNIANEFFKKTGWQPQKEESFAGALLYSKYNWVVRLVMKMIAKKAGRQTSMKQDYEYTDWDKVRGFARAFAHELRVSQVVSRSSVGQ